MLVSIFTPTHNPKHLPETHASLQKQPDVDWEWVITPNGPAIGNIPQSILADPRVRVVPNPLKEGEKPLIGALKRFACDNCKGDVFVELDHDDMLMPGTLHKVAECVDKGAGFIFSDAAVFVDTKDMIWPMGYSEMYGWETYEVRVFGRDLLATRAFDVSPRSLSEVYYAPDHVRAWERNAYYKAGGHDKTQEVGDDHDLMCRTYLHGAEFMHTGGCGYLYRNHPGNTVKSHSDEIQEQVKKNRDKYAMSLAREWSRRNNLAYITLGFGQDCLQFDEHERISINLPDSSVGLIVCEDFLQFTRRAFFFQTWAEIYRVLAPGGWVRCTMPSTRGDAAFAPMFNSWWNELSFKYVTEYTYSCYAGQEFPKARFQLLRCETIFAKEKQAPYVVAELCALKGQRQPGRVKI